MKHFPPSATEAPDLRPLALRLQAGVYSPQETREDEMESWHSRPVFFVKDAGRSVAFYRDKLGCTLDWDYQEEGRSVVCQVSREGLRLILAAQDDRKAGQGRVFITKVEGSALRKEIAEKGIEAEDDNWGMPVIVIEDPDGNQLLFAPLTE